MKKNVITARKLEKLRQTEGVSLEFLASASGLSPRTLDRISYLAKNGQGYSPRRSTLNVLARSFGYHTIRHLEAMPIALV